jgi:hypothetical protein
MKKINSNDSRFYGALILIVLVILIYFQVNKKTEINLQKVETTAEIKNVIKLPIEITGIFNNSYGGFKSFAKVKFKNGSEEQVELDWNNLYRIDEDGRIYYDLDDRKMAHDSNSNQSIIYAQGSLIENDSLKIVVESKYFQNEKECKDFIIYDKINKTYILRSTSNVIIKKINNFEEYEFELIKYNPQVENQQKKVTYIPKCPDMDSYNLGYSYAADQLGGGLVADCDYLYQIAATQSEKVNHYCFCKGVNDWLIKNK